MNSKQTRVLTTILLWAMVLGMILYMVLMGGGVKKPVELTLKDFLTLVEEDKVAAVKEELGSGLFYGLRTGSTYQPKDLPGKADFYFSASEEDFNRDLSLLLAKKREHPQTAYPHRTIPLCIPFLSLKGKTS